MKRKRAVAYLRVSTEDQMVNFSLEFQETHIKRYCQTNDMELVKIYNEGFGSGENIENRPEFLKMLKETLPDDDLDYVIVLADHRFARNHADAVNLVDKMMRSKKHLICVVDNINTENTSDLEYFRFKSIFSERQRLEIKFNCKYGMEQRATNGLYNGGRITGYVSVQKQLEIDTERAKIVKTIFEKYGYELWGYKKIAKYLNRIGERTINDLEFDTTAIKTILSNPIYIGYIRYDGNLYTGKHEPIICVELYEKCQQIMESRNTTEDKIPPGSYFLSGLIRCPTCGGSMVHSGSGKYQYYSCLKVKNGKTCFSNSVLRDYAENKALSEINAIINSPNIQRILHDKISKEIQSEIQTSKEVIKNSSKRLLTIEKNIAKTYKLYYKSEQDVHLKQIEKLNKEKIALEYKLSSSESMLSSLEKLYTQKILNELSNNFTYYFMGLEDSEKKEFLQTIIKSIHIKHGNKPIDRTIDKIVYHFDINEIQDLISA